MIFFLRIIVFSFFIILGFHISVRSIKGREVVSIIYALVLVWYTLLCRVHLTVDVAASDYGHTPVTMSTGEKIWQVLKAIFGMQANGNLAGNYREAFVLNVLLMIPLGYLCLLWMILGDSSLSDAVKDRSASVEITERREESERRSYLAKAALKTEMICIATSFVIEVTQEITDLGMFDINDILANSIGGGVGVILVISYVRHHFPRSEW